MSAPEKRDTLTLGPRPVEVRLRCLEAAARNPLPHAKGYAAGVIETAQAFYAWVDREEGVKNLL